MARTCMTCGSKQGPFTRIHVGDRKTGMDVFTCPISAMTDEKRKEAAMACLNRREKLLGPA